MINKGLKMKMISFLTLSAMLTLNSCAYFKKGACCTKEKESCAKESCSKETKCTVEKCAKPCCDKDKKCMDSSCKKAEAESCHKK